MKILVTGGAGFIGSHTADALVAVGHNVRVMDSLEAQIHGSAGAFPDHLASRAECIKGDVRNLEHIAAALENVEVVYHLAAHTGVGQSMYDLRSYVDTNCTGTATLLQAILERSHRPKRLILASSRAVYGEGAYRCRLHGEVNPGLRSRVRMEAGEFAPLCPTCSGTLEVLPTRENGVQAPVSLYGWTKLQQEQLCRHVSDTVGLDVVILRYFNVIGSRQSLANPYTGILTVFYKRIMSGGAIPLYERGLPIRDFVHIRDVVAANLLAIGARLPTRSVAINVGSGRAASIRDLGEAVARSCGRESVLEDTSKFRVGDIFACVADMDRARSVLGYEPAVDMATGIEEFLSWARTQETTDDSERAAAELNHHGLLGQSQS